MRGTPIGRERAGATENQGALSSPASAPAVAGWVYRHVPRPLIVGADSESEQRALEVADLASAPYILLSKARHADRDVKITVSELAPWRLHTPVLADDIISTARTMIQTLRHLDATGYQQPGCGCQRGVCG